MDMNQLVTRPEWECRAPAAFRRRGEHYWSCAEVPLIGEWTFIVNTTADSRMQLPERSLIAVGTERLLAVLDELGLDRVRSVYQVGRGLAEDEDALMVNRLSWIQVGEDSDDGWRKVFTFGTESGVPLADHRDHDVVGRLTNRVEVARFSPPKAKAPQS